MEQISILLSGGTMDGVENPGDEKKLVGQESAVKDYLDSLDLYFDIDYKVVCTKDSRVLTDKDRQDMLKAVQDDPANKILVIHGTFTMPDTGQFFKKYSDMISTKTVVLTGSMIPLKKWEPGDAPFNLGFALAYLAQAKPGVYIAMNGRIFDPDKVTKNIEQERFEPINE